MGAAVLPVAILAATGVSTALGVAGAVQEGQAAKEQAKYQAVVARNNAVIAEQKAVDAEQRGRISEQQQRLRTSQAIAAARANAAARGVLVDSGSALGITQDIAEMGELDALTIRSNTAREAAAHRQMRTDFESQQALIRASGDTAQRRAGFEATSSLLNGATSVASKWYAFRQVGAI